MRCASNLHRVLHNNQVRSTTVLTLSTERRFLLLLFLPLILLFIRCVVTPVGHLTCITLYITLPTYTISLTGQWKYTSTQS